MTVDQMLSATETEAAHEAAQQSELGFDPGTSILHHILDGEHPQSEAIRFEFLRRAEVAGNRWASRTRNRANGAWPPRLPAWL